MVNRVMHVSGFCDGRGVRGVSVSEHEGLSVIEVARGVIDRAVSDHTEIVSFQRSWPIDAYGHDPSVVSVEAVTRTTLDGGQAWREMWHYFGTASAPWPIKEATPPSEPDYDLIRKQQIEDQIAWGEDNI